MKNIKAFLLVIMVMFIACDEVNSYSNAQGLKEALNVGAKKAVQLVGQQDGFYRDAAIKILLPDEVQNALTKINNLGANNSVLNALINPLKEGLLSTAENVVLSMNRAAEDAATTAAPIFANAITSMTIQDATGILFGDDTAATDYLKEKTYTDLQTGFSPMINTSLDKNLVGTTSTNDIWSGFTSKYNQIVNTGALGVTVGSFLDIDPLNENLSEYVTGKALDGLFNKVAKEEVAIRTDPAARVNEILKSVFGQLDK